ncbi:MAG: alpha-amylase family glycosyl hydrolase [Roseibacillus sp.]
MRVVLLLALGVHLVLFGRVLAQPPVIAQLFDWSFAEISEVLPELEAVGYSHVHVSPVQKSVENGRWWGKYQPLDFREIEGPLGSREELVALAAKAREHGITLVVDVVLNHMAGSPHVTVTRGRLVEADFADFSKEDFHPFAPIHDWSDERQVRNRWLFGALPDLKTESESVRKKLTAHLLDLQSCGVGGFRVDSARHIPPEDLKAIFAEVEEPGLVVGEIAECSLPVFEPYLEELPEMAFFDFPQLAQVAACLRGEGPMSDLLEEGEIGRELPPSASVRLLRNHDLDRGEAKRGEGIDDARYRVPDDGWQIGYVALFGVGQGIPYVFVDQVKAKKLVGEEHAFDREGLGEGIAFFRRHFGEETRAFWSTKEVLAWTIGDAAVVVLSRGGKVKVESFALPRLQEGVYRDVFSSEEVRVVEGGVLTLPPLDSMRGYAFELIDS